LYNVGTIWAHEIDIFRSWKFLNAESFRTIQRVHWRKLPYWIFAPVGFALFWGVVLIWYNPAISPLLPRAEVRSNNRKNGILKSFTR
jgi:hypothetical protein